MATNRYLMLLTTALAGFQWEKEVDIKVFDSPNQKLKIVVSNKLTQGHKLTAIDQLERLKATVDYLAMAGFAVDQMKDEGSYPNIQTSRPDPRKPGTWTPWNQIVLWDNNLPEEYQSKQASEVSDLRAELAEQSKLIKQLLSQKTAESGQVAPSDEDIPF